MENNRNKIQSMLDNMITQRLLKLSEHQVTLEAWRSSEENRLRNMGQWRHTQKLTPDDAREIRRLHYEERKTLTYLSEKYDCSPVGIRKILNNKRFWEPNPIGIGIIYKDIFHNRKTVYCLNHKTSEVLIFDSAKLCAKHFGVVPVSIQRFCVQGRGTKNGHTKHPDWEFSYKKTLLESKQTVSSSNNSNIQL